MLLLQPQRRERLGGAFMLVCVLILPTVLVAFVPATLSRRALLSSRTSCIPPASPIHAMGPAPTTRSQSRSLSRRGALPPQHTATTSAEEDAMAEEIVSEAQARLRPAFEDVDRRTQRILKRMLTVFREHQVGTHMFNGIDGYGHGDVGRDTLENVYASLFGAEAALVRVQIFSGTHAISCALFGVLRPGDKMLGLSGPPYDTLEEVIGTRVGHQEEGSGPAPGQRPLTGNLKEWGVAYDQVDLLSSVAPGQYFDIAEIDRRISADPSIRVLHIQRSCGYQWRPSIPVAEIGHVIAHIRAGFPGRELVVFVDNCYGEFVEDLEPTHVGADLVAGSLIKVRKSVIWIRVVGGSAAAGRGRGTEGSGPN